MGFQISPEVNKYMDYARKAWSDFGLKEQSDFPPGKIEQLKKDYTRSVFKSGYGKEYDSKKEEYKDNATVKIGLDYFILNFTNSLFDVLRNSQSNTLNLALMNEVDKHLESIGAHSLARYMGKSLVPEFVDDIDLFKKMLWLEWVLEQSVAMVNLGIIPDMYIPMVGGPGTQLKSRLEATGKFLDKYVERHPEFADNLKKFRASYFTKTMDKSQASQAMTEIDRSFDAAKEAAAWMRPKKLVQEGDVSVSSTAAMLAADAPSAESITRLPDKESDVSVSSTAAMLAADAHSEESIIGQPDKEGDVFFDTLDDEEDKELEEQVSQVSDVASSKEVLKDQSEESSLEESSTVPSSPQIKQEMQEIKQPTQSHQSSPEPSKEKGDEELQKFLRTKAEILEFINTWVLDAPNRKNIVFKYDKANDTSRGIELIADIKSNVQTMKDLEKILANFIKEGETKRDGGTASFSPINVSYSLSHQLAEKYCPPAVEESNLKIGKYLRTVTSLSEDEIISEFTFSKKPEKSKDKEKETHLQSAGTWQKASERTSDSAQQGKTEQPTKFGK